MADFKLTISDPKTAKSYNKEVKNADVFLNLKIGETIKGDSFDMSGYEFVITGGSDYCGFPMRRGILGERKSLVLLGGVGYRAKIKGVKARKTVCGHKISSKISQINLKIIKEGTKKIEEIFPAKADEKKEEKPTKVKEEKKAEKEPDKEAAEKEKKVEPKEDKEKPVKSAVEEKK